MEDGEAVLESSLKWKQGKIYRNVKTFSRPKGGSDVPWFCRVSEHKKEEVSFDEMWEKLGTNKALNERE